MSPPCGDQWCQVLVFVLAGRVSSCSTLQTYAICNAGSFVRQFICSGLSQDCNMCTTADGHKRSIIHTHCLTYIWKELLEHVLCKRRKNADHSSYATVSIVSTNLLQEYVHTYIQRRNASILEINSICIAVTQIMGVKWNTTKFR